MKNKGIWFFMLLLFSFAMYLFGKNAAGEINMSEKRIVVILSGTDDDFNWNAANKAGIVECGKTYNISIEYVESVKENRAESILHHYGGEGYDLIITAGYQFNDVVEEVAPRYGKSLFCVINGTKLKGKNVVSVQLKEYEASYIAGLIAGHESPGGQFAAVGGYPNFGMRKLMDVFEKTAVQTALEQGIENASSRRAYVNSWDDVNLSKKMTEQMIRDGADIVFSYANKASLGCVQAADRAGVKYIGFTNNQNRNYPGTVIASVVFRFDNVYEWIIEHYRTRKLSGERIYYIGLDEDIFYPVYTEEISEITVLAVEKAMDDMKTNQIIFEQR